jgi:hypothetical protein
MRTTHSVLHRLPLALTARFGYSDPVVVELAKIGGIKTSKTTETNFLESSGSYLLLLPNFIARNISWAQIRMS